MTYRTHRREFLKNAGVSVAAANLAMHLPGLAFGTDSAAAPKQRLVFVFTPNGVIPDHFWPETLGVNFELKRILEPLTPFRDQLLTIHGICNQIRGDGDEHMRGIGCLLTGIELFPGDMKAMGDDTPAGWSQGISIDQHLKNQLQADPTTATRFGSLEFGVMIPDRADTWTRMCYSGPNHPVSPIDNPYRMFEKLYGASRDEELLVSVLDDLGNDFERIESMVGREDRQLLNEHLEMVRQIEKELQADLKQRTQQPNIGHAVPQLAPNIEETNDNLPQICRMQIELMVNSFAADFARVATFQITNSVGQPRMKWLGVQEGHHTLSHEPDSNWEAYENLVRINTWYAEQVAQLAKRLSEIPEPGGDGSLLDNTTIVWTSELGKGNSHTRDNIPFVLVGGGLGFKTGQALDYGQVPHNRLLMSFSEAMGHPIESFGNPKFCIDGALTGLT